MFDKLENEDAVYKPQESLKKMHSAEINPSQKMLIKLPYQIEQKTTKSLDNHFTSKSWKGFFHEDFSSKTYQPPRKIKRVEKANDKLLLKISYQGNTYIDRNIPTEDLNDSKVTPEFLPKTDQSKTISDISSQPSTPSIIKNSTPLDVLKIKKSFTESRNLMILKIVH